jgi:hypothetical protein
LRTASWRPISHGRVRRCNWEPFVPTDRGLLGRPGPACRRSDASALSWCRPENFSGRLVPDVGFVPPAIVGSSIRLRPFLARGVWNVVRGSFTNTRGTWQRQGPQIRPGKEASKLFRPARGRYPWPASGFAAMISDKPRHRAERVQVFLSSDEIAAIENFRYEARMPSLQAAVRELLRRGLASSDEEERTH